MNMLLLNSIVKGTLSDQGFTMAKNGPLLQEIVNLKYAELNNDMVEGDKIGTRATEAGIAASTYEAPVEEQGNELYESDKSEATNSGWNPSAYEIDFGVPMPATKRGGGKGRAKYPFDKLTEIGASFHISTTAEAAEPWKSKASTVSAANKKHAPKKFRICQAAADDDRGPGARVFRIA